MDFNSSVLLSQYNSASFGGYCDTSKFPAHPMQSPLRWESWELRANFVNTHILLCSSHALCNTHIHRPLTPIDTQASKNLGHDGSCICVIMLALTEMRNRCRSLHRMLLYFQPHYIYLILLMNRIWQFCNMTAADCMYDCLVKYNPARS